VYKDWGSTKVFITLPDQIRLVIGYHGDISYPTKTGLDFSASLHRLATAILKLEALKEKTHFDTHAALTGFVPQDTFSYMQTPSNWMEKGCLAHLEWRKKSGKVEYDTFGVQNNQIVPVTQLTGEVKEEEEEEVEIKPQADPAANLSFNLNLTDEQRRAKENLVLPHYKAQQEGTIYYDPDAADDFDDEDPDDDLDI
jgi:regulator of RNase E activity RraB